MLCYLFLALNTVPLNHMLWRGGLAGCVVSASLFDTSCSVYDHSILESANRRDRDHIAEAGRRAPRAATLSELLAPTIARAAAASTGTPIPPDASRAPQSTSHAPDAGSPQTSSGLGDLADDDAGAAIEVPVTPEASDTPPMLEASPACRGRIGYVSQTGRCYFVLGTELSWHQSRDECRNLGAQLATLTSESEQKFVASCQLQGEPWIGLSKFGATNFSWISNEPLSFTCWEPGAPRSSQESAVVIVSGSGLWSDRAPQELHPALCETGSD